MCRGCSVAIAWYLTAAALNSNIAPTDGKEISKVGMIPECLSLSEKSRRRIYSLFRGMARDGVALHCGC